MENKVGTLTLETKVNKKGAEKDIKELYKRFEELQEKAQQEYKIDGIKVQGGWNLTKEEQKEYDEISNKINEIKEAENERIESERKVTDELKKQKEETTEQNIEAKHTVSRSAQITANIKELLDSLKLIQSKRIINDEDIAEIAELKAQILEYTKEYEKVTGQRLHISGITDVEKDLGDVEAQLKKIESSIKNVTKKVIRWGLSIFGIRSAYMAVRQAMNIISQDDKQMKADLDYMKFALAYTLKPVVEWIVNAAKTILQYVSYIVQKWFGINLFANGSAKAFEESNKNAKKLQKTMAGFDEMNTLTSNNNGYVAPSFDLSQPGNVERPWWIDWIADHKDDIIKIGEVFAGLFVASKVLEWLGLVGMLIGGPTSGLSGILAILSAIAAYEVIKVHIQIITDEYNKTKEQIDNMAEPGERSVQLEKKWNEETKQKINNVEDATRLYDHYTRQIKINTDSIKMNRDALKNQGFWEGIVDATILGTYGTYYQSTKQIAENSTELEKNIISLKNMAENGSLTKEQIDKLKDSLKQMIPQLEGQKEGLVKGTDQYNNMESAINTAKNTLEEFETGSYLTKKEVEGLTGAVENYNNTNIDEKDVVINFDGNTSSLEQKTNSWISNLWEKFTNLINFVIDNLRPSKIRNTIGNIGNWITEHWPFAKGGIIYSNPLKLASGAIINQPGRGVPLVNAIGGERGTEGILPLTDEQQMDLLGASIARHMVINLTNITELDGKTIARKVEEVRANTNFLMNR